MRITLKSVCFARMLKIGDVTKARM